MATYNRIMSGAQILNLITSEHYSSSIQAALPDVQAAVEKIKCVFHAMPNEHGNNIPGILAIRDLLFDLSAHDSLSNCFTIVAPHTHWQIGKPIIYIYEPVNERYIIGHHRIDQQQLYAPSSFIFTKRGALPYEWCDHSVANMFTGEYDVCYQIINVLSKRLFHLHWPLGLQIDFRFKETIQSKSVSSIESDIVDTKDLYFGLSSIIKSKGTDSDTAQVGWHALSDKSLHLNNSELDVLHKIRNYFSGLETEEDKSRLWARVVRFDEQ